jgi:WD40 repeat protein
LEDEGGVTRMQCSKQNPYIFVSSTSGTLLKIDMRNGEVLNRYTAHRDTIMDFALDEENGKIVTAGDDKVVYVFDI